MGEPLVEPVALESNEAAFGGVLAAIVVVILMTVIIIIVKYLRTKPKDTFLIVGLSDSGKTQIYTKLIKNDCEFPTYTSMKENVYEQFLSPNGNHYRMVDYPGAERLRQGLYDNWLANVLF
uniref:Signal recognition particle receptor subunit beta n=1 Tax=Panagrolaimus sp. JU765 TaxID=591449 RepID=A0AC34RBX6_9BILA